MAQSPDTSGISSDTGSHTGSHSGTHRTQERERLGTGLAESGRNTISDIVAGTGDVLEKAAESTVDVGRTIIRGAGDLGEEAMLSISRLVIRAATGIRATVGAIVTGTTPDEFRSESQRDRPESRH